MKKLSKKNPQGSANIADDRVLATGTFAAYLIMVGIRSAEYTYTDDQLFSNTKYFIKCYNVNFSAYKALLFLGDYINGDYVI